MTTQARKKRSKRKLRQIAVLPSLVTLLNAVCGFAAIHFTARGMGEPDGLWLHKPQLTFFAAAGYMIFAAMIADALDGRLARMSRSTSSFGGQLDSLSDIISFGVAPAFLMVSVTESYLQSPAAPAFGSMLGKLLWLIAVAYVCCAELRLAKFNVENKPEESSHMSFSGLPSPAAAGVVMAMVLLYCDLIVPELQEGPAPAIGRIGAKIIIYALPLATAAVALLMVSNVPYKHVVNHYIRGRRPFAHVVRVVLLVLLLIWKPQLTMAVCFIGFAASGAINWVWTTKFKKISAAREKNSHPAKSTTPEQLHP